MSELYTLHTFDHDAGGELFAVLAEHLPGLSRHKARLAVGAGLVQVDGRLAQHAKHELDASSHRVRVDLRHGIPDRTAQKRARTAGAAPRPGRRFSILYHDQHVVVVDKASGVLSARSEAGEHGHVPELLRNYWRKQGQDPRYLGVVHRIDKETSGCLAIALTREAQRILGEQFASHVAERQYRCLVEGQPQQDRDTLRGKLGHGRDGRRAVVPHHRPGKDAITHFQVVNRYAHGSELTVRLETGRTHQVRVHLASIGCPIVGDPVYGPRERTTKAPRLMLHAETLSFDHPSSGERISVSAPLPSVFDEVRTTLRD